MSGAHPFLEIADVRKTYRTGRRTLGLGRRQSHTAVDGVTLTIEKGETLAIVGESGSGKSTTAKMALRLLKPDSGRVLLLGEDISRWRGEEMRERFRRRVQAVFQDPGASLNPRKTVGEILSAGLQFHKIVDRAKTETEVLSLLTSVGLTPPQEFARRYPHELSGGQQQRVAIARALSVRPDLIVADEPVSALDVSVRAQILELFAQAQRERGIGLLLITHDLAVVNAIAPRVAVMYKGRVVEEGATRDVFRSPQDEYTSALLASTPNPDPRRRSLLTPSG